MDYNFYIPQKLKGISPLIWEQKTGSPKNWVMLPEFNIDLIFNLDNAWTIYNDCYNSKSYNPTDNFCFLSGLHTKPLNVAFPRCHMFGIRLNTLSANLLFGIPCKELKNWAIDGDVIFKDKFQYIQDTVYGISDFHTRAKWLEEFIYAMVLHNVEFGTAMKISSLLDALCNNKSNGNTFRIEDFTGYSRMHSLRIFQKWYGVAPTEALAFRRYEKALEQIHDTSNSLTQIGLNCGFYDQAHFIRVFKNFADMTPKAYSKLKSGVIGQFSV